MIIYAAIAAAVYALVGLSFSLCYSTSRFFDFGHAAIIAFCPYGVLFLVRTLRLPFALAVCISVATAGLLGAVKDFCVYRPLRKKLSSPLILLIASIGVYIILQNALSLMFGDDSKLLRLGETREGIEVFGARITGVQLATVGTCLAILVATTFFMRTTRAGAKIRAVGEMRGLANAVGINGERVTLISAFLGSAVAGVAGVLIGLDVGMTPTMGMHPLLMGVVAMIIGGSGSPSGIALGALLLGVSGQLAVQMLGSQWHDPVAFLVLLVFLLGRPQGFLGRAPTGGMPV